MHTQTTHGPKTETPSSMPTTTPGERAPALPDHDDDYARIARAIAFLDAHRDEQPSLDDVAAEIGLSAFHCQRLFRRWAGVSPKRFLQALTAETAKRMLREGESVLDTALASGLSGPGRLHDLLVVFEAMTPGEYKRQGADLEIRHGFHATPFGEAMIARTDRGVCGLTFTDGDRESALDDLVTRWPRARFVEDASSTSPLIDRIFRGGDREVETRHPEPIHLLVRGTNFQIQVWQALLSVPAGRFVSYGALAAKAGKPRSARAVGTAVGTNPIGFLIPCHRVIRETGAVGGYRWGVPRKRAMHVWEAAQVADAVA